MSTLGNHVSRTDTMGFLSILDKRYVGEYYDYHGRRLEIAEFFADWSHEHGLVRIRVGLRRPGGMVFLKTRFNPALVYDSPERMSPMDPMECRVRDTGPMPEPACTCPTLAHGHHNGCPWVAWKRAAATA